MSEAIKITRSDLSQAMALRLVEAAVARARKAGIRICAVAADSAGLPLALIRMDGVRAPVVSFATDKAWTAANMRRTTDALRKRMEGELLRLGTANRERLMFWGGGVPIFAEGECIGALGVSGGAVDEDIRCAEAALADLGLSGPP